MENNQNQEPEKQTKEIKETNHQEQRIRKITQLYYSRPDIQKAIFDFSKNREVVPRYFEGFGKRPDSLQYPGDIFEMVQRGATSFHCSEELWQDPLNLSTNLSEAQLNELRTGWDLLIDIDSKYIDYSKIAAQLIIKILEFHGIGNIGVKFSGSKGFHIIIPWQAFPKQINQIKASNMFPQWPRIITKYLIEQTKDELIDKIAKTLSLDKNSKYKSVDKYIKGDEISGDFIKKVSPDIILVSPRHLFRAPYSLHEKTALASVVIDKSEIENFQPTHADPLRAKPKNFLPEAKENEARELLIQSLDWYEEKHPPEEKIQKSKEFKPIKIELNNLSEQNFPPCIRKILQGLPDGRKRALFALINLFRSIGLDRQELEESIYKWNQKNEKPLKEGYIKSQLSWSYRSNQGKPILPPNCKEYYQGLAVCIPDGLCKLIKNPVNYVVRKSTLFNEEKEVNNKKQKRKNKDYSKYGIFS